MKPKVIVQKCREELPKELKGDKLFPVLFERINNLTDGKASIKPYSTWIDRFCGKCKAQRNPEKAILKGIDPDPLNNILKTFKFRAYPTIDSDLRLFEEWMKKAQYFWISAAKQIQDVIRAKNWDLLKILSNKEEYSKFFDTLIKKLSLGSFEFPKEIKNDFLKRFSICINKGKKNKNKDNKGYPSASTVPEKMTLSIPLNGIGKSGNYSKIGQYCLISEPYSPSNHKGIRNGKYRKEKLFRKVSLRLNGKMKFFEFDVLFHTSLEGCPKDIKLTKDGDEWYIIFSMEKSFPKQLSDTRNFVGLDWNCRKAKKENQIEVMDIGGENQDLFPTESFNLEFLENRRTRRQKAGKSKDAIGLPLFNPTPDGRKEYQKVMDAKKDELKKKFNLHQKAGWGNIKKQLKGELNPEDRMYYEEVISWYDRALKQFQYMCKVEVANRLYQYRKFAHEAFNYCKKYNITDVGSPNDNFKEMKEEERKEGIKDWESHICNVRDENLQIVGLGKLREVIEHTFKKSSIRVHRFHSWKTTQSCYSCNVCTKNKNKTYDCSGCSKRINRSVNAVQNGTKLARECSDGDTHARCCSRNGKDKPYHGLQGWEDGMMNIKEKKIKKKNKLSQMPLQCVTV